MSAAKTPLRLAACALAVLALCSSPSYAYRMLHHTGSSWSSVACDNKNGFLHWDHTNLSFYYNPANLAADKHTAVQAAVEAALMTWTAASESDHDLDYGGRTSALLDLQDNQNTLVWGGTSALCTNNACHAITMLRYDSGQVLREVDIVFNELMDWRTDGVSDTCTATAAGTKMDTQGIATHELGHALGLAHPPSSDPSFSDATMGIASCSAAARTLHSDDRAGLQCSSNRYPQGPAYEGLLEAANCRSITGWGWNADYPNESIYVELWKGSTLIGIYPAAVSRPELSRGDNDHGFSIPTPSTFKNAQWQSVSVKYTGTGVDLSGSPKSVICGVRILPPTLTPTENNSSGGVVYSAGVQFSSTHSGFITQIGFYKASGETGTNTLRLWTDSGVQLASVTPTCGASGWCWGTISPVAITAGTRYRASVNTNTYQSKTSCGLGTGITNGPLTAHQGYWGTGNVFPNESSACNSNFFVDVKFDL